MPPKAVATGEEGAAAEAAAGGVVSLTPKETQMLAVVASLMGDIPEVDFSQVAELVGQKYARNARSACKKLFEKLKAIAPPGAVTASASTSKTNEEGGNNDDEGGELVTPKKTPKKKGTATPRKTGPRKTTKKATAAKAESKDEVMEEVVAKAELADEDDEMKYGKSIPATTAIDTFAPLVFQSGRRLPLISSMCGYVATFPIGYSFPADATEEELYKAHLYQMTVEKWRADKIFNNCDPERAITPS